MSNEEIVLLIQNGVDVKENQEKLWLKNRKFVILIIKRYCGYDDDLDDLEQQGFLGLIMAANKYKATSGNKFITYAAFWIKQSIIRYNENCGSAIRVPSYLKSNIRKYERFKQEYKNTNGKYPSDEELKEELNISQRTLENLEKTIYNMRAVSLNSYVNDSEDTTELLDLLKSDEDIEETITYSVYRKELQRDLKVALDTLDKESRSMIYSIYYQGNSWNRTAGIFGCTKQNVSERIGRGFYRILHSQYRNVLESYMYEGYRYNECAYSKYAELEDEECEFLL